MKSPHLLLLLVLTMLGLSFGCGSSDSGSPIASDGDQVEIELVNTPYVALSGQVAVKIGETIKVKAQTINGTDSAYTWTSADTGIATVSGTTAEVTVTGVAKGQVVLTATGADSKASGSWGVYVWDTPEPGISPVHVTGAVALEVDKTTTLTAVTDGETESYTWSSSDESKATVSAAGVVTGVAKGEVIITAKGASSGQEGSWGLYVWQQAAVIPTVTVTGELLVKLDGTLQLSAATANGTDTSYTWSSSDETKATVSATGKVTPLAVGEVLITATGDTTKVAGVHGVVIVAADYIMEQEVLWKESGHSDKSSEAFNHWNTTTDKLVPVGCAKCHSEPGFADYLGADGTAAGSVENGAKIGTVIGCKTCHSAEAIAKTDVAFPSGKTVGGLGASARCMICHQGTAAGKTVADALAAITPALADDDTVSTAIKFTNVHYLAAGATAMGANAAGGFEYTGKTYDHAFQHEAGLNTCISCHDPHSGKVKTATCKTCHTLGDGDDTKVIRANGSVPDYNGNGNSSEGIYYEIAGLKDKLYAAMQAYAKTVAGTPIVYSESSYPYWFIDTNDNGTGEASELVASNGYKSWTARLVKAAYNYQFATKDPGAYAHNAKYVIELLTDSIADLNAKLTTPIDMSGTARLDVGHFADTAEAWRHWDSAGSVPATCSKCHSAEGLPFRLANGVDIAQPTSAGLACTTCHNPEDQFKLRASTQVTFPSGLVVKDGDIASNLCMNCHQARESTVSVNTALGTKPDDTVDAAIKFINSHYLGAGATWYGTQAKGAYEYAGKKYPGAFTHAAGYTQCGDCHTAHGLDVKVNECATCHSGATDLERLKEIRMTRSAETDYDGNSDTSTGISVEIDNLMAKLLVAIQTYAHDKCAKDIAYSASVYPYFIIDTNGNGTVDTGETSSFNAWTPRLLKAAYNYQFITKDPGAYAHNAKYVIALIYDSIESLAAGDANITLGNIARGDEGHFDGNGEAFRHWDTTGAVDAGCARCHSSDGFISYATTGVDPTTAQKTSWGLSCNACHSSFSTTGAPRRAIASVTLPGGTVIQNANAEESFLCYGCHMGRESGLTVEAAITAGGTLSFKNVHYLAAAGVFLGSTGHTGLEYAGKTYAAKWAHTTDAAKSQCTYCHEANAGDHSFKVTLADKCTGCHDGSSVADIRRARSTDYNGNGNTSERLSEETRVIADALYVAIKAYAPTIPSGAYIVYNPNANPYWFVDANANGTWESTDSSKFTKWDAKLLRAAYNYQLYYKEPAAWAHNTNYIIQLLIDSTADLGGDVSAFHRP